MIRSKSSADIADLLEAMGDFHAHVNKPVIDPETETDTGSSANTSDEESDAEEAKKAMIKKQLLSICEEENKAILALEESANREERLAEELFTLYEKTKVKHREYVELERLLSYQAGQLLNAMQQEESRAMDYSTSVRRVRQVRKKMLSKITQPKWEVPHHYHMTCVEHAWGHEQAHVLDVGEMMPGHLRIFALARWSTIYQKSMMTSLERAKKQRNGAHDQIKRVYRQLREIRADIKQVEKLLDAIKKKSHLFVKQTQEKHERQRAKRQGMRGMSSRARGSGMNAAYGNNAIRRKYLTTLQITPPTAFISQIVERSSDHTVRGRELGKAIDNEWKTVGKIVREVETEQKSKDKVAEELESLRKSRKNLHIQSLPTPFLDASNTENDSDDDVDPKALADEMKLARTMLQDEKRRS